MKRTLQKAGILFLIFIAALVIYFISARNAMEKENTVYTSMEEPSLPVVYMKLNGKEINCLHGYMPVSYTHLDVYKRQLQEI